MNLILWVDQRCIDCHVTAADAYRSKDMANANLPTPKARGNPPPSALVNMTSPADGRKRRGKAVCPTGIYNREDDPGLSWTYITHSMTNLFHTRYPLRSANPAEHATRGYRRCSRRLSFDPARSVPLPGRKSSVTVSITFAFSIVPTLDM